MNLKTDKIYPDSGVELTTLTAKNYDNIMNIATLNFYRSFIGRVIKTMDIQLGDKILDLGCGTGRNACIMETYLGNTGGITGIDISHIMGKQFKNKCAKYQNTKFIRQRIDVPFSLSEQFDKIFISFVIHGFPHEVRQTVIENIYSHLKPGGTFFMLDFAEFNISDMPPLYRFIFKTLECKYAFDFIERDWKQILGNNNFTEFEEFYFFRKYVRLLKAKK
ncbi:MAG: class I SAM-dependent methyltransferase [candidate division Zixibacteria bacterium]|nr:class I SAM-dependent methyltransferase [candidate division Zixibacteria bacterium]